MTSMILGEGRFMNVSNRDIAATVRAQYSIKDKLSPVDPATIKTIAGPFKTVELTAAQRADIEETTRRTSGVDVKAMLAQTQANRAASGGNLQIGDISKLTDREAQGALAVAEKLQSLNGWRKMSVTVSNNGETTLSLNALADQLRQRLGMASGDPTNAKAGAVVDLSA
jgi:hypothetical protein